MALWYLKLQIQGFHGTVICFYCRDFKNSTVEGGRYNFWLLKQLFLLTVHAETLGDSSGNAYAPVALHILIDCEKRKKWEAPAMCYSNWKYDKQFSAKPSTTLNPSSKMKKWRYLWTFISLRKYLSQQHVAVHFVHLPQCLLIVLNSLHGKIKLVTAQGLWCDFCVLLFVFLTHLVSGMQNYD